MLWCNMGPEGCTICHGVIRDQEVYNLCYGVIMVIRSAGAMSHVTADRHVTRDQVSAMSGLRHVCGRRGGLVLVFSSEHHPWPCSTTAYSPCSLFPLNPPCSLFKVLDTTAFVIHFCIVTHIKIKIQSLYCNPLTYGDHNTNSPFLFYYFIKQASTYHIKFRLIIKDLFTKVRHNLLGYCNPLPYGDHNTNSPFLFYYFIKQASTYHIKFRLIIHENTTQSSRVWFIFVLL